MSSDLFTDLAWLSRPPENFARRCRTALETPEPLGTPLRALASVGLDMDRR